MIHNDALVIVEGDGKTTFGKVGPDVDPKEQMQLKQFYIFHV